MKQRPNAPTAVVTMVRRPLAYLILESVDQPKAMVRPPLSTSTRPVIAAVAVSVISAWPPRPPGMDGSNSNDTMAPFRLPKISPCEVQAADAVGSHPMRGADHIPRTYGFAGSDPVSTRRTFKPPNAAESGSDHVPATDVGDVIGIARGIDWPGSFVAARNNKTMIRDDALTTFTPDGCCRITAELTCKDINKMRRSRRYQGALDWCSAVRSPPRDA